MLKLDIFFLYWEKGEKIFGGKIHYVLDENLCNNQNYKEINAKKIDIKEFKLFHKKHVEKLIMNCLFCSFCNQVVIKNPMNYHMLDNNYFAEVSKFLRKTSYYRTVWFSCN